jgi:hypothetical protein
LEPETTLDRKKRVNHETGALKPTDRHRLWPLKKPREQIQSIPVQGASQQQEKTKAPERFILRWIKTEIVFERTIRFLAAVY